MMGRRNESFPVGYYQNTFSAAGESEGSGSSGRMDAEFSASEDSSVPFRKCINLNSDKGTVFFVPSVVIPLSGMSPSERKDLILRLKVELEQIRILQKKIEFQRANGVAAASSLSCTNGKLQPKAGKKSTSTSGQDIKAKPSGSKSQLIRSNSGKFESAKPKQSAATQAADAMLMKRCENLLKQLMAHSYSWVFGKPVDVVGLKIPDYLDVIKQPMDLGTIKGKLSSNAYSSPLEFVADVRLTFTNALTYNPSGNDVHVMADTLSKYFEVRWKAIEKKLVPEERTTGVLSVAQNTQKLPLKSGPDENKETLKAMPPSKKRKVSSIQYEVVPEPAKPVMTDEEKHDLGRQLESIMEDMPESIVDFLKEQSSNGRESGEEEIEIDIDDLSNCALLTLRKLVDEHLQQKQKNPVRDEQCEIEIVHESGFSNSSMQPSKVNGDEDVDIGGNEPPVSSYSNVEKEKYASLRDAKSISSGSSSDSDSDSSTDSESDNAKVSDPVTGSKVQETLNSEVQQDGKMSGSPIDVNKSYPGLDQLEQTSHQKANSVESDSHQNGETATGESQVSPGKLYRAALLKNRFAETILKAKEKTLSQGDKGDPEKLRREREELDMQRRKERARLQAEAKAAEDAQRQAEAKAVAEAKRKREEEREAARQTLLKMEKTVEINENSRFLEDLEMLSTAPPDNLPSSADETSPEIALDRLGSFNIGGSNPLEQLGLFMKDDDEDEEHEPLPPPPPPPSVNVENDVEEGEID